MTKRSNVPRRVGRDQLCTGAIMTYPVLGISALLLGVAALPIAASAQAACHGTPRGTTLAYEYGKLSNGNTQGVAATFAVVRLGARMRDLGEDFSGQEVDLRLSAPIGTSRFKVCPLLGVGYTRDEWDFEATSTMTSQTLALRGGVAVGAEFPVAAGFAAIPFVQVAYRFAATKFDIDSPSGEIETSADTASGVDIEYGVVGRYRNFFAGVAASRDQDTEGIRPYQARWIFGFAFSGGGNSPRASTTRSRSAIREP